MAKICPKCYGSGLQTSVAGGGGMPSVHHAKCILCDGKGWLPDDSTVSWLHDYE